MTSLSIHTFSHNSMGSNTYLLVNKKAGVVFFIDLGSVEALDVMSDLNDRLMCILLSHSHYDHIKGLNFLVSYGDRASVYASVHTIEGLSNPKLNLSFYHEDPIVYSGPEPVALEEGEHLISGLQVKVLYTPGHNPGCLSFIIKEAVFTGDAYIPFVPVVTKLKGGDRQQAAQSLRKLKSLLKPGMTIYPGHGPAYPATEKILNDIDDQIRMLKA